MPDANPPGSGLWGWLGRQIGHVKTAVRQDPLKPVAGSAKPQAAEKKPTAPMPGPVKTEAPKPSAPTVVYRTDQVAELPHPTDPNLKLRRTVIDEVIVEKNKES